MLPMIGISVECILSPILPSARLSDPLGDSELFSAVWYENKVRVVDWDDTTEDVELGPQHVWQTLRFEVDVDLVAKKSRLTLDGQHKATIPFTTSDLDAEHLAGLPLTDAGC